MQRILLILIILVVITGCTNDDDKECYNTYVYYDTELDENVTIEEKINNPIIGIWQFEKKEVNGTNVFSTNGCCLKSRYQFTCDGGVIHETYMVDDYGNYNYGTTDQELFRWEDLGDKIYAFTSKRKGEPPITIDREISFDGDQMIWIEIMNSPATKQYFIRLE